jgi:hypothetical protein
MAAATGFVAVNVFTGAPLFALWVGSQVGSQDTTMAQVFVVLLVLALGVWLVFFAGSSVPGALRGAAHG